MAVDPATTREVVKAELGAVRTLAVLHRWGLIPAPSGLRFTATMYAHNGDLYIIEFECDDYKELPPLIEFIDPSTGERGTQHAYPQSTDSLFHTSGPCICAPFSRKAYRACCATGPHSDWSYAGWTTSKVNNCDWSNFSTLGDMLGLIQTRLARPDMYRGRMG
jgi:hypothetical protein